VEDRGMTQENSEYDPADKHRIEWGVLFRRDRQAAI
jgi:hypothetical protein